MRTPYLQTGRGLRRKCAARLALALAAWAALSPARADESALLSPDANSGCGLSARYKTPDGVAVSADTESGGAPADLPGTGTRVNVPGEIVFPLAVDPFPARMPPQTRRTADNSLYLGDVTYNRASGDVKIGDDTLNAPTAIGVCQ